MASECIDEFFKDVPPEEKDKRDWNHMPPEYHLLMDCRRNMRGLRQQALRLVFQIQHVYFLERKRMRSENEREGEEDHAE